MTLVWGIAGAAVLAGLIVCRKLMRAGTTSLAEAREKLHSRIDDGERQLHDDAKKITLDEQIYLLRRALEDLLRLEGGKSGYALRQEGDADFVLESPGGNMRVSFTMREQTLRGSHRVLHGHERWKLSADGIVEEFTSIAALMAHLNDRLHGDAYDRPSGMAHLTRRFRHLKHH